MKNFLTEVITFKRDMQCHKLARGQILKIKNMAQIRRPNRHFLLLYLILFLMK